MYINYNFFHIIVPFSMSKNPINSVIGKLNLNTQSVDPDKILVFTVHIYPLKYKLLFVKNYVTFR